MTSQESLLYRYGNLKRLLNKWADEGYITEEKAMEMYADELAWHSGRKGYDPSQFAW